MLAKRNQGVAAGDILVQLSSDLAQTRIDQAGANLTKQTAIVKAIKASYQYKLAKIEEEKENLAFELRELNRAKEQAKSHGLPHTRYRSVVNTARAGHHVGYGDGAALITIC